MISKALKYGVYYLIVIVLGALLGFIGWFFLYVVNTVLHFLWVGPEVEGQLLNGVMYEHEIFIIPFIMLSCLILGYIYKRFGVYPKPGIYYAKQFKDNMKIAYDDIIKIFFLAMIPLFLGASVGPEAAVIGLYFILSSLVSDITYVIEKKLNINIVKNQEEEFTKNLLNNKLYLIKIVLMYFVTAYVLVHLTALDKFPNFYVKLSSPTIGTYEILALIPLIIFGIILALFYEKSEEILEKGMSKLGNYQRILLTGGILSLFAVFFPILILSGEATLHVLVNQPIIYSGIVLIILAFLKLFLTNLCIQGNLRGGHIFPIIFASFLFGTGIGLISGVDLVFAITVVTTGSCFKIFSNIFAVFLLLTLFFPIKLLIIVLVVILIFREKIAAQKGQKEL